MSEQPSLDRDYKAPISSELVTIPVTTSHAYDNYPSFDEIGGLDEQITRLRSAAEQFDDPKFWSQYDIRRPNGILIVGSGGTGKTMLAKAFARETRATIMEVEASAVLEKWVGQANKNLVGLFKAAAESKDRVVILFNEIDGLFGNNATGNEGVSNSLIAEMKVIIENLHLTHPNAIVVGTTNAIDGFDPALLRPGRFDVVIQVPNPNTEARTSIFGKLCSRNFELYDFASSDHEDLDDPGASSLVGINVSLLAEMTEGMSGADIESILQAARMKIALHKKRTGEERLITQNDILLAIQLHRTQRLSSGN